MKILITGARDKPPDFTHHVATHARQDFVDTNVAGTLNLLEEAASARVSRVDYRGRRAGAEEHLRCHQGDGRGFVQMFHHRFELPCLVLRTSRFTREDLPDLRTNAPAVVARHLPRYQDVHAARGWSMFHRSIACTTTPTRVVSSDGSRATTSPVCWNWSRRKAWRAARSPVSSGRRAITRRSFTAGPYPVEQDAKI